MKENKGIDLPGYLNTKEFSSNWSNIKQNKVSTLKRSTLPGFLKHYAK